MSHMVLLRDTYSPTEEQRGTRHLFVTCLPVEITVISGLVVSQFNEELRQRLWCTEIPGVDDGMIRSVQRVVTTAQYHRDQLVPSKFKLIYLQHFQVHHIIQHVHINDKTIQNTACIIYEALESISPQFNFVSCIISCHL